jgi:hypothetical protein
MSRGGISDSELSMSFPRPVFFPKLQPLLPIFFPKPQHLVQVFYGDEEMDWNRRQRLQPCVEDLVLIYQLIGSKAKDPCV